MSHIVREKKTPVQIWVLWSHVGVPQHSGPLGIREFPEVRATFMGDPHNKDYSLYSILEPIL